MLFLPNLEKSPYVIIGINPNNPVKSRVRRVRCYLFHDCINPKYGVKNELEKDGRYIRNKNFCPSKQEENLWAKQSRFQT